MTPSSVQAALKSKGQAMTLTRTVLGTFDPVTGMATGATTTTYAPWGITTSYGAGITSSPDSLILSGDKQAIIDAVAVQPLPGDKLTIAGEVWTVIAVDASAPSGVALLYKCQVRK